MDQAKFDEIIDYAVKWEKDAVAFYQRLQNHVKFEHQREALKDFEGMENGHIAILEGIRSRGKENIQIPDVPDLKISDYLVESPPEEEMTYQNILVTAMKREERSHSLYTRLAARSEDPEMTQLLQKLAAEEAKHKLHFETIYDEEILKEN